MRALLAEALARWLQHLEGQSTVTYSIVSPPPGRYQIVDRSVFVVLSSSETKRPINQRNATRKE